MKRASIVALEAVYEFSMPFVDQSWLSYPYYILAWASGGVLDLLEGRTPAGE